MGNNYGKGLIRSFIGIMILIMWYFGPFEEILGRTYKNYYYSKDKKHCLTIIVYTGGDGVDLIKSCSPNYDASEDNGRGIYLIPGKFNGRLPKDNFVRLDYIGGLETDLFYFRWENDSLTIRLANWAGVITENKLHPEVKIDMKLYEYERGWSFPDSIIQKKMVDEWKAMRNSYQFVVRKDLKMDGF